MTDYDPSRDEETKAIHIDPKMESESEYSESEYKEVVILPDGTKPVSLGSGVVTRILGEGGMAIVYEIWNEQLGVKRAIKLLRPNSSKEHIERFDREIKITAQLDHPNIIDIHAVGEWNGLPYIEMEMVDGVSLDDLISRQGAIPLEVCTAIAIIICEALNYTHHHKYTINNKKCVGILHRDLKPGNILISKNGIVRLTDFGVATPTSVKSSSSSGKVIGSMQYLAPEQLEEDNVDARADIYSFGCIMYEILTGNKTFPDRKVTNLVKKRLKNEYKSLSAYALPMPTKLRSLIGRCLQLDINKRPADIKLVLEEIEQIHNNISANSPEEVVLVFVTGERPEKKIEELSEIDTEHHDLPIKRFIGVALIALGLGIFGFYMLFVKSRVKSNIDKTVIASIPDTVVTVDKKSKKVIKTKVIKKPEKKLISRKKGVPDLKKKPLIKIKKRAAPRRKKKIITKKKKTPSSIKADTKEIAKDTRPPIKKDKEDANESAKKIIDTMLKADASRNYTKVLDLYASLPPQLERLKEARLLKLRALIGTNKTNKLYFDGNHINDCEFYLAKAKYLYAWILGIAKTTPALLTDKEILNTEILYYLAKCKTNIYNGNPTPSNKVTAMKSWFNVKNKFRNNQNHSYFHEANESIRELGKKE
jgi:serine/threonine protein kinase